MKRKAPATLAGWSAQGVPLPPPQDLARMALDGDREAAALLMDWLRLDLIEGRFRFLDSEPLRHALAHCIDTDRLKIKQSKRPAYSDRERRADVREIATPILEKVLTGMTIRAAIDEIAAERALDSESGDAEWIRERWSRVKGDAEELEGIVAAQVEIEIGKGLPELEACAAVAISFDAIDASAKGVRKLYRRACRLDHRGHHWIELARNAKAGGES